MKRQSVVQLIACVLVTTGVCVNLGAGQHSLAHLMADPGRVVLANAVDVFGATFNQLISLDYFVARECGVVIPGIDHELAISWDFAGSGDLFEPMPSLKVDVHYKGVAHTDVMSKDPLTQIAQVIAAIKLQENLADFGVVQWLCDQQTSPLKLFVIKLCMLLQTALRDGMPTDHVLVEAMRLLVRLSLVDDGALTTWGPGKLSTLMPSFVTLPLQTHASWLLEAIDSVWALLRAPDDADQNKEQVYALVAVDQSTIDNFARIMGKSQTLAARPALADMYCKFNKCILQPYVQYRNSSLVGLNGPLTSVGNVQASISAPDNGIPADVRATYLAARACGRDLVSLKSADGQYWLVSAYSKPLSMGLGVLVGQTASVIRDYAKLRQQLRMLSPEQADMQRSQYANKLAQAADVRNFIFKTEQGRVWLNQAYADLHHECPELDQVSVPDQEQDKEQYERISGQLAIKRQNLAQSEQELKKMIALRAVGRGNFGDQQQHLQQAVDALRVQVKELEDALEQRSAAVAVPEPASDLLPELEHIVREQRAMGQPVDEKLIQRIAQLKLAQSEQQAQVMDARMAQQQQKMFATRARVEKLYFLWADQLEQQIMARQQARDGMPGAVREVQLFKDRVLDRGTQVCADALRVRAKQINAETHLLHRYIICYQSLQNADNAPETMAELRAVYAELSPVVARIMQTNNGLPSLQSLWRVPYPELSQMCQDLADENPLFTGLRQRLINVYDSIMGSMTDHKDDKIAGLYAQASKILLYRYLPEIVPVIEKRSAPVKTAIA